VLRVERVVLVGFDVLRVVLVERPVRTREVAPALRVVLAERPVRTREVAPALRVVPVECPDLTLAFERVLRVERVSLICPVVILLVPALLLVPLTF
jgi:hypothetical protein